VKTQPPSQITDSQQIRALVDALAQEFHSLRVDIDIQLKRITDTHAKLDLFPPTQSPTTPRPHRPLLRAGRVRRKSHSR
jgi:hypothetical protein